MLTGNLTDVDRTAEYHFKTKPYVHQVSTWERSRDITAFALLTEMGTGKSKMLIDTAAWLYLRGKIDALVIVAPKGVYRNWVDSELPAHMPDKVSYRVGVWSAEKRKVDLDQLAALFQPMDGLKVLLMNVEALGRELESNSAFTMLEGFLKGHRALLAIDESTAIKNPTATRTKALLQLRTLAPYRRILSGQPAPNGPLDLFSQCAFLDPDLLGYGSFFVFKARYAQLVPMHIHTANGKKRRFSKVAGYRNLEELRAKLSKFSAIVKKEDCLDLPPKVFQTRHVALGPKQRSAYEQMRKLAIVELERALKPDAGDDLNPNYTATASLVITQMLRLHQILCGFLVNDAKQPVVFEEPNPRLETLMELLDECSGKVVIWATYRLSVRQIAERIAALYGPDRVGTFYGDTPVEERRRVNRDFQDPASPLRFLVANKTGARGNTWTAAHTAIYYSYDHDLDIHDQSQDRIHRIGQTTSCAYVYLMAAGTMEEKIRQALRDKQNLSKIITASNWQEWL